MSMEDSDDCTPPDLQLIANDAAENLLPQKSAKLYYKTYDLFLTWCNTHSVKNYTENVLLAYFAEKAKILKVSTLWSTYSMLKSTIMLRHNIDISKFAKLIAFIKQKNSGYKAKKSNIFSREDLNKFLSEAPDENYLMWKVCLIFGVASRILQGQGLEQISIQHQQNSSTSSRSNQMEPIVIQNNTNCTITININN